MGQSASGAFQPLWTRTSLGVSWSGMSTAPKAADVVGKHKAKFFVYMLESPSDDDAFVERSEQRFLKEALALDGIFFVARTVLSPETFRKALSEDLLQVWDRRAKRLRALNRRIEVPVVHISAHGDTDGIQLSNGHEVSWSELGRLLGPINDHLNGLFLCLSSCQGFAAKSLGHYEGSCPFAAIVGHEGQPSWSDAAVGYSVFYHLLRKGVTVQDAVARMRKATADDLFKCQSADEARMDWAVETVLRDLGLLADDQDMGD